MEDVFEQEAVATHDTILGVLGGDFGYPDKGQRLAERK